MGLAILLHCCGIEHTIDNRRYSVEPQDQDINAGKKRRDDFKNALGYEAFIKDYSVNVIWSFGEPCIGECEGNNKVVFSFQRLDGRNFDVESFDFHLFMKSHGHGGVDRNRRIVRMDPRGERFEAENFSFTMPGPWELKLEIIIDGQAYAFDYPVFLQG